MITETVKWFSYEVSALCAHHQLYTDGSNQDFEDMLAYVDNHTINPTFNDLLTVASDIYKHSSNKHMELTTILYYLHKKTIEHLYSC